MKISFCPGSIQGNERECTTLGTTGARSCYFGGYQNQSAHVHTIDKKISLYYIHFIAGVGLRCMNIDFFSNAVSLDYIELGSQD